MSIVASPVLGLTLDRWGYRVYLIQIGLVCMLLGRADVRERESEGREGDREEGRRRHPS